MTKNVVLNSKVTILTIVCRSPGPSEDLETGKRKVEISQKFLAFSEYMNFMNFNLKLLF